jgi:hypothetical protein
MSHGLFTPTIRPNSASTAAPEVPQARSHRTVNKSSEQRENLGTRAKNGRWAERATDDVRTQARMDLSVRHACEDARNSGCTHSTPLRWLWELPESVLAWIWKRYRSIVAVPKLDMGDSAF